MNGEGIARGTLRIRDPQTNRLKVQAQWIESGIEEINQGLMIGWVRNGGSLYANTRTTFFENGSFTTQIGGEAADGRLPAVIKHGACTNPFGPVETNPVPPPPAGSTAARQTSSDGLAGCGRQPGRGKGASGSSFGPEASLAPNPEGLP